MIFVFLAAFLFGLVHPGSKLLMSQGLSLIPFCFLYLLIRWVVQIPVVLHTGSWKIKSKKELSFLILLGIVGAGLQLTEFVGISENLPVGVVSFLVYSHPIWTLFLSRYINHEPITRRAVLQLVISCAGILLISGFDSSYPLRLYIGPLAAGLFLSLWITLSNRASKAGCSATSISFYYDFFALLVISALLSHQGFSEAKQAFGFLTTPKHFLLMAGYSLLIGYLPNLLFYVGNKYSRAQWVGLVLLLEPVISTGVSCLVWGEALKPSFILGAFLILSHHIPFKDLTRLLSSLRGIFSRVQVSLPKALLVVGLIASNSLFSAVHVVELVPQISADYTVTEELQQIKTATHLAQKEYLKQFPTCRESITEEIRYGSEKELFERVKKLGKNAASVLVGFSRTNFARLAAKALSKGPAQAISIGASYSELNTIHPRFFSIVSPWTSQWQEIQKEIRAKCKKNTLGIFDSSHPLSKNFREAFEKEGLGKALELSHFSVEAMRKLPSEPSCLFFAVNFSQASGLLSSLIDIQWKGEVLGIGDWNYFTPELDKVLLKAKYTGLAVSFPSGWNSKDSEKTKAFSVKVAKDSTGFSSPLAAYSYDAMLLALHSACTKKDLPEIFSSRALKGLLLRNYQGISSGGNFLSPMYFVTKRSAHER